MAYPTEPLPVYLERRERELTEQIATLRKNLEPRERELAEVCRMRASLAASQTLAGEAVAALEQKSSNALFNLAVGPNTFPQAGMLAGLLGSGENLTIKEKIVRALRDHFSLGARPTDLRNFIKEAYGDDIPLTSLSPQLSRLREEGTITQTTTRDGEARWIMQPTNALAMLYEQSKQDAAKTPRNYKIVKGFKSPTQRFREGTTLEFKDQADLEAFKKTLQPLDFDDLEERGFLEAEG